MSAITSETRTRIERVFAESERADVEWILEQDCGNNLPLCEKWTPAQLDRIRFAVLKISGGDMARLMESIALAQSDWRDVLVAAGFATDPEAHMKWMGNEQSKPA